MLRCGAGVNYANLQKIDLKRSLIHLSIYRLISAFLLLWQSGAPAQTQPPSAPTVAGQVPATADAARVKSDQIRRGEYVARLGDCVACHTAPGGKPMAGGLELKTPFGALYSTNITPDRETGIGNYSFEQFDRSVREGVAADGHNLYSAMPDTVQMLKTGQNRFGSVSGNMVEVVHHSTQYFSDADLTAVATYLKWLPPGEGEVPMPAVPASGAGATVAAVPAKLFTTRGGMGYVQFCVDCHRQDGSGVPGIFPPLAQNASVASANPSTLLHVTLTGWKTAQTAAHPRVYTMPAFARLSDQEISEILSFVRQSWGNNSVAITATEVKQVRSELSPKVDSSPFETPRLAAMLERPNADQLVRGMRLHLETKALLPQNVGNQLSCTSCHLNAGTVADGSPFVGVSAFFPSYGARAGRAITLEERINGCFLRSMNGKPIPVGSDDMKAMVAYFEWMKGATKPEDKVAGRGVGKIDTRIKPNAENGQKVYVQQCVVCHGKNGEGLTTANGTFIYPPLWGDQSFNIGAGMARTYTAAAFVKRNMPIGMHEKFPLGQGGLSDQDAVDVSEYFTHQPRPDFAPKAKDWPKDPKPPDARY